MTRVYIVVEGQTEEGFVKDVLAETFWPRNISLRPIILGPPGHKGGRTSYDRVWRDVVKLLRQDQAVCCSTMVDYYGLGRGFPGTPADGNLSSAEKVRRIQKAMRDDICSRIPGMRAETRFVPYVQLHEYEGLLFSDPAAFANALGFPQLVREFQVIRGSFPTPEDIDDRNAPSKRVLLVCPSYSKPTDGVIAARAIGIAKMRQECPNFRHWVEELEALAG